MGIHPRHLLPPRSTHQGSLHARLVFFTVVVFLFAAIVVISYVARVVKPIVEEIPKNRPSSVPEKSGKSVGLMRLLNAQRGVSCDRNIVLWFLV